MSSFLSHAAANPRVQFATTAVVSGAIVAGAILGYQQLQHENRLNELKSSIPSLDADEDEALRRVSHRRRGPSLRRPRPPAPETRWYGN